MTNKIEDFETGKKENKKIIFVDLSTSENLENKKKFKYLLNKVAESPLDELGVNLKRGGIVCKGQGKARKKRTRMY